MRIREATVRIREATARDLGAVVDALLLLDAGGAAHDPRYVLAPDAPLRLRAHLHDLWFGRFWPFPACLLACEDATLAGVISAGISLDAGIIAFPRTAHIDNLWVQPSLRRGGLGRQLVSQMSARTAAAGFPRLTVSTLVRDTAAVAFWRAVGFDDLFVVLARP